LEQQAFFPFGKASIGRLIDERATATPDRVAIVSPGRASLSYKELQRQIAQIAHGLKALGIGRSDRVAITLANGPDMATAFLGTAATATAAPLNPNYTTAEFDFYLTDLAPRAIIVGAGVDSPVRALASTRGIAVLDISPRPDAKAGVFEFGTEGDLSEATGSRGEGDDVALILHTSGTTSRPKMIPLSHSNLCTSAANVAFSLSLHPDDRCLNVMPLFHIHGLVAGLLSSLSAGGSVICPPEFSGADFFQWVQEFGPTWYTAVPAMHQEVLIRAKENGDIIARHRMRFIRSSSAALAPKVMSELERAFNAPVIEAYGMTEAAHQIASNPLPPRPRKAGSVGLPSGPDVSIIDETGQTMPQGQTGEIAIRGPNVSAFGRQAATDDQPYDWFRTGDLGYFDRDGYLFISGRLKEMINRGGEKISPREIDEVLLEHPHVAQVVACAIPDSRLGEDVVAVVVRRPGASLRERDLREFASTRLAPFKVPRRVVFVDQIPKGATGKIQRIGLADRLGISSLSFPRPSSEAGSVTPRTHTEAVVAEIWKDILKLDHVRATDNFFELGGDSLSSAEFLSQVEDRIGVTLDFRPLAFGTFQQVVAACEKGTNAVTPENGGGAETQTRDYANDITPIWGRFRRQTRKALISVTLPIARRLSIESYPGWFGRLHGFNVPNNVTPRVSPGTSGGANSRIILRLLESVLPLDGDVAECGVWKAATLIPVGLFLRQRGISKTAYGFDSFEGLDESVEIDIEMGGAREHRKKIGGFSDTSYEELVAKVNRYGLSHSVKLVRGYFNETLGPYADRSFCFVHLDCVIYESYRQCLDFFYPRLVRGGIILIDEYHDPPWPGCTAAVDEFLAKTREPVETVTSDNQIKFYIRKNRH
jgi:acyl-CoA synthetase (AMP-forming)/AMP-acid ligase II